MKDTTIELVRTVLAGDDTVSSELKDAVLRACSQTTAKRNLIGAQKAMGILQVSRPTLRSYVKNGILAQINFSSRKVRFDEAEVRNLAYRGAKANI